MYTISIFPSIDQARKCRLVSSGPLSQRIDCGSPRCAIRAPAGEARIHSQGETLSRECVNHAQHPDRPAGSNFIVRKIQSPFLIGGCVLA
jgi:hypothetical protein